MQAQIVLDRLERWLCGVGFPHRLRAGSFRPAIGGQVKLRASRKLDRPSAPTLFNALSMHRPTTHQPQPPCRLLQASNSCPSLDMTNSMPWPFQRQCAGQALLPRARGLVAWTLRTSLVFTILCCVLAKQSLGAQANTTYYLTTD